jgi:hypothetical protein
MILRLPLPLPLLSTIIVPQGIAGHCAGLALGTVAQQLEPVPSYVHLNFSCNVVVVKRKAVMTAFEHALHVFSRPVDPEVEMGAQQVGVCGGGTKQWQGPCLLHRLCMEHSTPGAPDQMLQLNKLSSVCRWMH